MGVIRQHDPLFRADGLGPKKLEKEVKVDWIDDCSFSDDGAVVKVYVDFPEPVASGAEVQCEFARFGVELIVRQPAGGCTYGVRVKECDDWILEHERKTGFAHEIVPEKCKHRLASSG